MEKFLIILSLLFVLGYSQNDKVQIQIYTESLCPYCIDFYTTSFKKAINTENFSDICDFEIFPYGNASQEKKGDLWEFECQHGPNECYGNTIETCADHFYGDDQILLGDFIVCLSYKSFREQFEPEFDQIGPKCADQVGIDWDEIYECANGELGNELQHQVADITESLNPKKEYVPWINVNGQHDDDQQDEIQDNMLKFVCQHYKGQQTIEACGQYNLNTTQKKIIQHQSQKNQQNHNELQKNYSKKGRSFANDRSFLEKITE